MEKSINKPQKGPYSFNKPRNWKDETWEKKRRAAHKMVQDVKKYLKRKGML